jgi:pimeloyl-ACP methyl ester carboxylesterase
MIAQDLALGFPERVDRLVLAPTPATRLQSDRAARSRSRSPLKPTTRPERMRALAPFAFAPDVDRQLLAKFIEKKSRDIQPDHGYRGQIAAVLAHDALDRLASIKRPTLVITGAQDTVIPAENSRILYEHIPEARLAVIPGAGHLFFVEQPELTLAAIEKFLLE